MSRRALQAAGVEASPFVEALRPGDAVEFTAPPDIRGWIRGRFVQAENDEHGLWLEVHSAGEEFLVPHSWVRAASA